MTLEYHAAKDIGILTERINCLEEVVFSLAHGKPPADDEESHRLSYPLIGKSAGSSESNANLCRTIAVSMYTVKVLKTVEGVPTLVEIEMTRNELDDYIASNPGKEFGEFITDVTPSFEDFL
jgi:hypothetical protein